MLAEQPHTCTSGHCRSPVSLIGLQCPWNTLHEMGTPPGSRFVQELPRKHLRTNTRCCALCACASLMGRSQVLNMLQPPQHWSASGTISLSSVVRQTQGLVPLCSLTSSPSHSVKWTQPARERICHPCSPAAAAARLVQERAVRPWHMVFGQCLHSSEKLLLIRVQLPCLYSQSYQRECKEMPGNWTLRLHCSLQGCLVTQQHTGRGPSSAPSSAKAARGSTTTVTQHSQPGDTQNTQHWAHNASLEWFAITVCCCGTALLHPQQQSGCQGRGRQGRTPGALTVEPHQLRSHVKSQLRHVSLALSLL